MESSLTSDPRAAYLLAVGAPALECLLVAEADPTAGPLVAYVVDWTLPQGERVLAELPWTQDKFPRVITDEYRTVVGWALRDDVARVVRAIDPACAQALELLPGSDKARWSAVTFGASVHAGSFAADELLEADVEELEAKLPPEPEVAAAACEEDSASRSFPCGSRCDHDDAGWGYVEFAFGDTNPSMFSSTCSKCGSAAIERVGW